MWRPGRSHTGKAFIGISKQVRWLRPNGGRALPTRSVHPRGRAPEGLPVDRVGSCVYRFRVGLRLQSQMESRSLLRNRT